MEQITYIDRDSGQKVVEKVYGASALKFIYGDDWVSKFVGVPLLHALVKNPIFSSLYGMCQKTSCSKKKIQPFIDTFHVDTSEFLDPVSSFQSFNDFFIRKLKPSARPIVPGDIAVMPADARYRFFQNIDKAEGFIVKGQKFDLAELLGDAALAKKYEGGAMVMARLCPSDYHRYHFPCASVPGPTRLINGWLYSVNPIALKKDIHIFTQNKRAICEMDTKVFGKVQYIDVGATNVGSMHQTYTPNQFCEKGSEKGYFSFGASSLILLFEPGQITFDQDLIEASDAGYEIRCLMGQSMGKCAREA